jgi:hypothetical protein
VFGERRDHSGGQPVIPPKTLSGFPEAKRAKAKTPRPGGLRKRWKDPDGAIYEWDYRHGTVEVYDRYGRHIGEFDPETGKRISDADPSRSVEP